MAVHQKTIQRGKRQAAEWENVYAIFMTVKGLISRIHKKNFYKLIRKS